MTCYPMTAEDYDRMCGDYMGARRGFTGSAHLDPLPQGRWWLPRRYEFRLDPICPLTWHWDGLQAQPDRHFESDMGTVPKWVQALVPALAKDRWLWAFGFHDSAYTYGGWYVLQADGTWGFTRLSRAEADAWLYRGILAEGGSQATAKTVWAAVRAFGRFAWDADSQAAARLRDGIQAA